MLILCVGFDGPRQRGPTLIQEDTLHGADGVIDDNSVFFISAIHHQGTQRAERGDSSYESILTKSRHLSFAALHSPRKVRNVRWTNEVRPFYCIEISMRLVKELDCQHEE